jgi:hypothetical protein
VALSAKRLSGQPVNRGGGGFGAGSAERDLVFVLGLTVAAVVTKSWASRGLGLSSLTDTALIRRPGRSGRT